MPEEGSKSLDLLGVKPVAQAVEKATTGAIDGAAAILSRICLPAAEELGLFLRDKVSGWRAANFVAMAKKLEAKMVQCKVPPGAHAHPRLVHAIMEQGSLNDDSAVQEMWAGLLASSCTEKGDDDSNLIFVNLLTSLTKLQARVIRYACTKAHVYASPAGLIAARGPEVRLEELCEIADEKDIQRLDREMDCLRMMGLLEEGKGGFSVQDASVANISPSPMALHMYVRCQGSRVSPVEFFKLGAPAPPPPRAPTAP